MSETEAFWDRYWATGALHSCLGSFADNYEGAIAETWFSFFRELEDGAVLVDIGTGNGAVAAMAVAEARERGVTREVHGVDLADIDPQRTVQGHAEDLAPVRFHPRTSADAMPFDEASVDAVIGQYALEYTPLGTTLAELWRVMRPAASARFVIHHPGSVILRSAAEELDHARFLFDEVELFRHAQRVVSKGTIALVVSYCLTQAPERHRHHGVAMLFE